MTPTQSPNTPGTLTCAMCCGAPSLGPGPRVTCCRRLQFCDHAQSQEATPEMAAEVDSFTGQGHLRGQGLGSLMFLVSVELVPRRPCLVLWGHGGPFHFAGPQHALHTSGSPRARVRAASPSCPPCPLWEGPAPAGASTLHTGPPSEPSRGTGLVGASYNGFNLGVPSHPHTAAVPRQTH